jgi:hypothetical protein
VADPKPAPKRRPRSKAKPEEPKLVPRPDGKGALLTGGVPGNKGGTGRPPNEVRALARELGYRSLGAIDKVLAKIEAQLQEGKSVNTDLLLKIADHANKYGLGTRDTTEHVIQGMPFVGELAGLDEEELDARLQAAESRET